MLGIETSCDATAVAVVCDDPIPENRILSNVILSQHEEHRPYGGIVPEIAARSHLNQWFAVAVEQVLLEYHYYRPLEAFELLKMDLDIILSIWFFVLVNE